METSHRTKESKEDDQVAMATGGGPPVPLKACPAINLMVIDNHLNNYTCTHLTGDKDCNPSCY